MSANNPIELIAGLGNPGSRYEDTRHNAGFWLLDQLARSQGAVFRQENKFAGETCKVEIANTSCKLLKPNTYMNRSGQSLKLMTAFYRIPPSAVLVVHDDIDLPPGTVRLKRAGGHGGHNGLRDITHQLGQDFMRLRLGVGHPRQREQVVTYVLERPSRDDAQAIDKAIERSLSCIPEIIRGEFDKVMNTLHSQR